MTYHNTDTLSNKIWDLTREGIKVNFDQHENGYKITLGLDEHAYVERQLESVNDSFISMILSEMREDLIKLKYQQVSFEDIMKDELQSK